MTNPVYEKLMNCYDSVKDRLPFKPKVALVLGSGLGDFAEQVEVEEVGGPSGLRKTPLTIMTYRGSRCPQCPDTRGVLYLPISMGFLR